jgi:hypothetical protein
MPAGPPNDPDAITDEDKSNAADTPARFNEKRPLDEKLNMGIPILEKLDWPKTRSTKQPLLANYNLNECCLYMKGLNHEKIRNLLQKYHKI